MPKIKFHADKQIGSFMGVADRDSGFAADIVVPYENNQLIHPQLGQFLLVHLSGDDHTLGRITRFTPAGMLATPEGEDYMNRLGKENNTIPDDIKRAKVKYRVNLKLLGAIKPADNGIGFDYAPSQRRLPHLGAKVYWPSDDFLAGLCRHVALDGAQLGHFALGEFVYSGKDKQADGYFEHRKPELPVTFDVNNLVSRRSAVFARAGYGKSNLIKLLLSELYKKGTPQTKSETPSGIKMEKPAGILVFDANGEYFWPTSGNRPGLCDVPHLSEHIVVYTNHERDDEYKNWKAGDVRLDLRKLSAGDVFGIVLPADRQEQQNVLKLKLLGHKKWEKLVDLMHRAKDIGDASDEQIGNALGYRGEQQIKNASAEISAARSNAYHVVKTLHDPDSTLIDNTLQCLSEGKLVVVDISLLNSKGGEVVAGLLMRKIFSHNQTQFTNDNVVPVVAVIEEAQSVLGGRQSETSPFVEWVKEGRKYDLGAILVTQQPGSLAHELLSQTDNWFCFHLLSEGDTACLGKSNSHYSRDILAHIVAEPIKGNCYMWTSDQPFVLPVRVRNFESEYKTNIGNAKAPKVTASKAADDKAANNIKEMAKLLAPKLQAKGAQGLYLEPDGQHRKKIKSRGSYFWPVKAVALEVGDTRDPNNLKEPLFHALFPGAETKTIDGETYFSAPKEEWEKILGK